MSITVIDYGSGNLKSAAKALEAAGNNVNISSKILVTSNPKIIKQSDKIVLPGQGSFKACKNGIDNIKGLQEELNESVLIKKKPIYGICAGMQLFATTGHEEEKTSGLNWIPGEVIKLDLGSSNFKIPHMGWNELKVESVSNVFKDVINKNHAYFIHSYEFITKQKECVIATTNYGNSITVSIEKENIVGTQFHPEKSQKNGLIILENFLNWKL